MGNAESNGHQSRRQTPTSDSHERKRRSLSPTQLTARSDSLIQNRNNSALSNTQNSSSSFHSTTDSQHQAAKRRIQQRRAKSFRVPTGQIHRGSFRIHICHITGLNDSQKQLIQQKWLELDKSGILEMGRNVFETVFKREKKFLRIIGLSYLGDRTNSAWLSHGNFRILIQKFCESINTTIRQLYNPEETVAVLHEFGAFHYYNYEKENSNELKSYKLPSAYWDNLTSAINKAAKDLQVESSRGSESPSRPTFDKRFLLPGDDMSISSPSPSPTPFVTIGPSTPRRYNSVCPIAAEAWNLLAVYVSNQIKFGYQMELMLQSELKRLIAGSIQFSCKSPSSDENTNFSSRDDSTLDGLSIQTNTTAIHGGGSISSTSNSSNSSSGSSDLPAVELMQGI